MMPSPSENHEREGRSPKAAIRSPGRFFFWPPEESRERPSRADHFDITVSWFIHEPTSCDPSTPLEPHHHGDLKGKREKLSEAPSSYERHIKACAMNNCKGDERGAFALSAARKNGLLY
jgi:hypothetical protein